MITISPAPWTVVRGVALGSVLAAALTACVPADSYGSAYAPGAGYATAPAAPLYATPDPGYAQPGYPQPGYAPADPGPYGYSSGYLDGGIGVGPSPFFGGGGFYGGDGYRGYEHDHEYGEHAFGDHEFGDHGGGDEHGGGDRGGWDHGHDHSDAGRGDARQNALAAGPAPRDMAPPPSPQQAPSLRPQPVVERPAPPPAAPQAAPSPPGRLPIIVNHGGWSY